MRVIVQREDVRTFLVQETSDLDDGQRSTAETTPGRGLRNGSNSVVVIGAARR
ncbi:hypothetical protein J6590_027634 [Homalodisca vitripennis]|nr:hypothetical protein J6590_027634 [Homalodisca vitripennis]